MKKTKDTVSCTFGLSLLVVFLTVVGNVSSNYRRVCYYTNWAQYRGVMAYSPENYETGLCTHVIYSFGKVVFNTQDGFYMIKTYEWNDMEEGFTGVILSSLFYKKY